MKKSIITLIALFLIITAFGQKPTRPTVMVVPSDVWCNQNHFTTTYDNQGEIEQIPDYTKALQNDPYLLLAIGKINTLMADRGFPIKDLEATTKSIKKKNVDKSTVSSKKGSSLAESPNDRIRREAKADIIMELTYTMNVQGPRYSITYNLRGLDAYTNKQIAGTQGTGKPTFTAEVPVLLEEAVVNNMEGFCDQLMRFFEDIQKNGREVAVDINVFDNGSGLDLETEFGGMELSEIIDKWMANNTVNHMFNKSDASENFIEYEQVRIPLYQPDGMQMNTETFVRGLSKYLKEKYPIKETKILTRGLGYCILVIGEK